MFLNLGVVVIGRNEGERLRRCLLSVSGQSALVVYVDSGSTDGSVELAASLGVVLVELDMGIPFTAARARNEGFSCLLSMCSDIDYVQFVDGDCEVDSGWLTSALLFLDAHQGVAVVCGRRRERHPEHSIYNLLCDIEWDTPLGEAKACGGDAMFRADAFKAVGGYRASLIAGEEPELCVRLRSVGWQVWRIDDEMTLHDAAIARLAQWWKRAVRGGHAYAEGANLHGAPPERHFVRESRRIWLWAMVVPIIVAFVTWVLGGGGLLLLLIYPLQVLRLARNGKRSMQENTIHAFFLVLGKFPEFQGQITFWWRKVSASGTALIEYK